jgi:hypothetical protein
VEIGEYWPAQRRSAPITKRLRAWAETDRRHNALVGSFDFAALIFAGLVLAVAGTIRASTGRYDAHLPAVNRRSTVVGACTALVALALLLAATVDIAVGGTFCSWPQSATTLSGLGLIVSLIPALVAIRQTLRHERRSVTYWVMVGTVVTSVGLYAWLLSGADHSCPGGFVSEILS